MKTLFPDPRPVGVLVILTLHLLSGGAAAAQDIQLSTVPDPVYKNQDGNRENTESWYFNLVVSDRGNDSSVRPLEATIQLLAAEALLESQVLPAAWLERMRRTSYVVSKDTPAHSLRRKYSREELFDFRLGFPQKPFAWNIDRVRVSLRLSTARGKEVTVSRDVPVLRYAQRTALVFPFKGPGLVTQGQINNGGHAGHSNQFALDVIALTPLYSPMLSDSEENSAYAAWGKELIAPADGVVVYARNDVPDNPPGANPEDVFPKLPEPLLATAGNAVVIDHGNSEYSVLMHMQKGSVRVAQGQRVKRGDPVGGSARRATLTSLTCTFSCRPARSCSATRPCR